MSYNDIKREMNPKKDVFDTPRRMEPKAKTVRGEESHQKVDSPKKGSTTEMDHIMQMTDSKDRNKQELNLPDNKDPIIQQVIPIVDQIFSQYDTDNSGTLDRIEAQAAIKA